MRQLALGLPTHHIECRNYARVLSQIAAKLLAAILAFHAPAVIAARLSVVGDLPPSGAEQCITENYDISEAIGLSADGSTVIG